jgi:hypothetical protein
MTYAISPHDYLIMLQEQHAEYSADPLSLRKAIAVSMFGNHISEHVFAAYTIHDTSKLDACPTAAAYRSHLEDGKPELRLVRDLCDFGKHGPILERKSVKVSATTVKEAWVLDTTSFLLGIPNHVAEDKIVVTLQDGSERFFDHLIGEVVRFWSELFASKNL